MLLETARRNHTENRDHAVGARRNHNGNPGTAGSLGAHWPPRYEPHNRRIKAFAPFKLHSEGCLERLRRSVAEAEQENPGSTRTTVRAFVDRKLSCLLRQGSIRLEASMPADQVFPGHELVYLGRNSLTRLPCEGVLEAERGAVDRIRGIPAISEDAAMRRVRDAGYIIGILEDINGHLDTLLSLYNEAYELYTFDITPEALGGMFEGGNIVMAARDRTGRIVSSMVAEHAIVGIDGRPVSLYELSDYATFGPDRGKGLMTAMQIQMVRLLRSMEPYALIFAEDRASWTPVNISSQKAGLEYGGTLIKHCRLRADRDIAESGDFENLNVWFAPEAADVR